MVLHWHGGEHTHRSSKRMRVGKNRWTIPEDTLSPDPRVGASNARSADCTLSQSCRQTDRTRNGWTEERVRSFRGHHDVAVSSSRRMGRAGRNNARGGGANDRRHDNDGAAYAPAW